MRVRSGSHGTGRRFSYGCSAYHERGTTVCANRADVPMVDADDIVIETLLDDVLDLSIVTEAVDEAVSLIHGTRGSNSDPREALDREIAKVEQERARLVAAITAGGSLDGLIGALQGRETRLVTLRAERAAVRVGGKPLRASDVALVRRDLLTLADDGARCSRTIRRTHGRSWRRCSRVASRSRQRTNASNGNSAGKGRSRESLRGSCLRQVWFPVGTPHYVSRLRAWQP
jgi:hypothetical protein